MSKEKQIKKVSKSRQEYLKFRPFADDLRKAESWCELDGVLNRYQTVKNLSKMGYRKASEVAEEIFAEIEEEIRSSVEVITTIKDEEEGGWYDGELNMLGMFGNFLAELKKKYTQEK